MGGGRGSPEARGDVGQTYHFCDTPVSSVFRDVLSRPLHLDHCLGSLTKSRPFLRRSVTPTPAGLGPSPPGPLPRASRGSSPLPDVPLPYRSRFRVPSDSRDTSPTGLRSRLPRWGRSPPPPVLPTSRRGRKNPVRWSFESSEPLPGKESRRRVSISTCLWGAVGRGPCLGSRSGLASRSRVVFGVVWSRRGGN